MTTKYIPITPLNFHSEIRVDTHGDEVTVTVYNCDIKHLDLLIQQLEALKAEYASKPAQPTEIEILKGRIDQIGLKVDENGKLFIDQQNIFPNAVRASVPFDVPAPKIIQDEPAEMTAVLGPKPDPTGWYRNALRKASTENFTPAAPAPAPKQAERKYFTCAETATFVRKALKDAFPKEKFSVRSHSYSGGASIDIRWTDGLTEHEVKQVVDRFSGATFDGMQDLKEYVSREDENGVNVHYGADFIFCHRDYSREFTLKIAEQVAKFESVELPAMNKYDWFDNDIRLDSGKYFSERVSEARYCYSAIDNKYIGSRFGYLPQWIECMISMQ